MYTSPIPSSPSPRRRALIDDDGTIRLDRTVDQSTSHDALRESRLSADALWEETPFHAPHHISTGSWLTIDEDGASTDEAKECVRTSRSIFHGSIVETIDELQRQYSQTGQELLASSRGFFGTLRSMLNAIRRFVTQPVWVPGRRMPRQHARGTLFLLDTIRFGATFGFIFVLLFSALNYQSFWVIAQSYIDPITELTDGEIPTPSSTGGRNALGIATDLPATYEHNGATVLPPVGPPTDVIIIPKLKLNVPIISPPSDALLREDWPALEKEIQEALLQGVAHYPGTAHPGQAGNFFLTGHSSFYTAGKYTSVFARLYQLEVNDEYTVYYHGDRFTYRVTDKREILPTDVSILDQPLTERRSTLMTCTPVGTTLRRLVITAREVDQKTHEPIPVGGRASRPLPEIKTAVLPI